MSRRNLAWLLGISSICLFGYTVTYSAPSREKDRDYELVRLLVDVLQEVRQKYVVDVGPDRERKLVEDMINGGLERLDPHSQYINPRDYKQFNKQSKGKFGGIGIQVGPDRQNRGQLTVISPMVGTPAYDAGILAGDIILKIDGKSTENMRLPEAVDLIQGPPGEKVVLTVLHEGAKEPVDIPIVRDEIKVQSVLGDQRKHDHPKEWDFFLDHADKIGYIRLTSFSENAAAEMRAAVEELQKEGLRGLIIDLRNNPGGLLRAAVEISDMFLTEGRIVSTKGRNHKDEVYDAKAEGTLLLPAKNYPIVILVNRFSASASEIVSAALQDHGRAIVIGERTYGKGSVQNVIMMEKDTSALKLTTASYWRPNGKNIHRFPDSKETDDWGVKPTPWCRLTGESLDALKAAGMPDEVVKKLGNLKGKVFQSEAKFLEAAAKALSPEELSVHRAQLLDKAKMFEAPLKDQELLEYWEWRRDRDVFRFKKNGAPLSSAKNGNDKDGAKKDKKPYVDKVLQRAVDYLKEEIGKIAVPPAEPRAA